MSLLERIVNFNPTSSNLDIEHVLRTFMSSDGIIRDEDSFVTLALLSITELSVACKAIDTFLQEHKYWKGAFGEFLANHLDRATKHLPLETGESYEHYVDRLQRFREEIGKLKDFKVQTTLAESELVNIYYACKRVQSVRFRMACKRLLLALLPDNTRSRIMKNIEIAESFE